MFQKLVNRNEDLRRLVEKGYAVAFEPGYLIVRDIPYIDDRRQLHIGAIVAKLVHVDATEEVVQDDHQVYFAGSHPHNTDGTPITNLAGGPTTIPLSDASSDVVVQRSFSNKPRTSGKFADFFEKIESYVGIISGPAMALHAVTPYTFRVVESFPDSVFNFHDTLTSRAAIGDLSATVSSDVIAIIGLGGTGAYLLDYAVKMPVREIRAFDHDGFYVHNAYRSPGRLEPADLGRSKAEVYADRYRNFRKGLSIMRRMIDASSADAVEGVTFAFVCVDNGLSRAAVFDLLLSRHIPFVDIGMGLYRKNEPLNGMLRVTYYSAEDGARVRAKGYAELSDRPADLYRTTIQTSELNALNASLALIKFKQLRGFYFSEAPYHQLLFEVGDCRLVSESELE